MGKLEPGTIQDLARRFMPRLSGGVASLESAAAMPGPDLSLHAVTERWARSRAFLLQFIRTELGDHPDLVGLAERTLQDGREGLEMLGHHREETAAPADRLEAGLEVIVRTDGSRPAFLVRDDFIVPDSSPPGHWTDLLTDILSEEPIRAVLGSVGRVDITHPLYAFAGTGWLIAPDLVATNRHVAQLFVDFAADGGPRLKTKLDPRIDFGHEHRGRDSHNSRPITALVFAGAHPIPPSGIDHALLDLAVFRLGPPARPPEGAQQPLTLRIGPHAAEPQTEVFVTGYPGRPSPTSLGSVGETDRVLRLLFDKLWGFKRLAPGLVTPPTFGTRTMNHDASTLGGNSGSLIMGLDSIPAVMGIHYGGNWGSDRANWGHVMAAVLDEPGLPGLRFPTLSELCSAEGVDLSEA